MPFKLKVRRYADRTIKLIGCMDEFPGAKAGDKIGEKESNEIILNNMPNGWIKKLYVQFLIVNILLLKSGKRIEHMEIEESIYEDFIEPSYKILLGKMITMIVAA